ncbi:hypothetical protein [Oceanobacillus profundus]|uniref:Uncharacterized protein n=1 Tax=Oceanobacillus profundus TaxID=372463 RepID=A0A417YGK9_9BACI|nr:hypothetical protein [Oceanobacillus profundus]MBQ9987376.1 hypothetical protein [Erysipelotrichales bacterium]MBR2246145.1 hypothetical protein [Bacilli bacterium]MBR3119815.1 hypothetical protein [Oceanobacillus sp.]RHW31960.1 hypothetical protein D1B32_12025 [Oceanobacillus profundus]
MSTSYRSNMSHGEYVEAYVLDLFEDLFYEEYRPSTEEEDFYYGTDCFIGDVPVDVTLSDSKNYVKYVKKYMLEGVTIHVLRRYGNAHHKFPRPVLVFHFDVYGLVDRSEICFLIEENLTRDIVADILGLYN